MPTPVNLKALDTPKPPVEDGGVAVEKSLRDEFAGLALPGVYYTRTVIGLANEPTSIANECYELADAFIARRKR